MLRAETGIELYRKGKGVINIKNRDGSPVDGGLKSNSNRKRIQIQEYFHA